MDNGKARFEMVKANHKKSLEKAIAEKKIDPLMIDISKFIASTTNYFSTSTCSGRIVLLQLNDAEDKAPGAFFRKWHSTVKVEEVWQALQEENEKNIWFKQEPFVFLIGTNTFENAKVIIEICKRIGVKRCGINFFEEGKVLIEIMGSQGMAFMAKEKNKILVSKEFMQKQIEIANQKWKKNDRKLKEFEAELKKALK